MSELYILTAVSALACLPLSLALAAAGLPLTSASLLFSPPKRVKIFRDKYGQQTATFCLLAGMAACLGLAGGLAALRALLPGAAAFWLDMPVPLYVMAGGVLVCGGLAAAYRALWQSMKDNRPAHAALGLGATLCGWALGYCFVVFFRHFVVSASQPEADPALFLPPLASYAWFLLPQALLLSLGMAGAWAATYLIYRREKDDFGRDYYGYSLKLACRWALLGCAAALAVQAAMAVSLWPLVRDLPIRPVFFWSQAASCAATLLACALWVMVARSQNPMRLKLHCFAGCALAWLGLTGNMAACARFFLG